MRPQSAAFGRRLGAAFLPRAEVAASAGTVCLYAASALLALVHAQQPTQNAGASGDAIAQVQGQYSCEQADALKFDAAKYSKLSLDDRVLIDAQWNHCDIVKKLASMTEQEREQASEIVTFANPAATDKSSKVFYGLAKRKDLENLRKNCKGAGRATGITLMIVGASAGVDATGQLGSATYEYSDVVCTQFKEQIENDNLMTFLAPQHVVNAAIAKKLTPEVLKLVPLVSNADKEIIRRSAEKAGSPPEVRVTDKSVVIEYRAVGAKITLPKKIPRRLKF